jgi:hypothetical protein
MSWVDVCGRFFTDVDIDALAAPGSRPGVIADSAGDQGNGELELE